MIVGGSVVGIAVGNKGPHDKQQSPGYFLFFFFPSLEREATEFVDKLEMT